MKLSCGKAKVDLSWSKKFKSNSETLGTSYFWKPSGPVIIFFYDYFLSWNRNGLVHMVFSVYLNVIIITIGLEPKDFFSGLVMKYAESWNHSCSFLLFFGLQHSLMDVALTDVAFSFPPSFYFGIVVPYFWLLYLLQCVDGLCWMWEMSTLGKASGSWSWYCFKNPLLCWWPGKLGSDCKYLSQIDLKVQTTVSIIFLSVWLHLCHTLKEICSLEWYI